MLFAGFIPHTPSVPFLITVRTIGHGGISRPVVGFLSRRGSSRVCGWLRASFSPAILDHHQPGLDMSINHHQPGLDMSINHHQPGLDMSINHHQPGLDMSITTSLAWTCRSITTSLAWTCRSITTVLAWTCRSITTILAWTCRSPPVWLLSLIHISEPTRPP